MTMAIAMAAFFAGTPTSGDADARAPWWNAAYTYRMPLRVPAGKTLRVHKPVEVDIDLGAPASNRGADALFRSMRVVEHDVRGEAVDENVPFQFEKLEGNFGRAGTRGTLVFLLAGDTRPGRMRYYHIYYGVV